MPEVYRTFETVVDDSVKLDSDLFDLSPVDLIGLSLVTDPYSEPDFRRHDPSP
jgi:hypothetical protein